MKRTETYCDRCGCQMTALHSDGDQYWEGAKIKVKNDNAEFEIPSIVTYLSKNNGCGTSSKAEYLDGREFCSFTCLQESVMDWLNRMRGFWK